MSDYQKSITFTIMSAEVESLRSAIRAIGEEYERRMLDTMIEYYASDAIEAAIALLPENVKVQQPIQPKSKEAFSDVLG